MCIRLKRLGSKQKPYFRVVVTDSQRPTQGQALEHLGIYDPLVKEKALRVDTARVAELRKCGAYCSPSVARLFKRAADLPKA
ncbi:MAG TPA: 30S ribosomal protein S16 [Candidatus Methanoperedens sp.]|nr:30S ribosomal protein S16 [Candidatus Methanoperedens sp.]